MYKFFLAVGCLLSQLLPAQSPSGLTLTNAYEAARANYPAIKQKDLVKQTADITIENLQKGFLPQVTLSGQATYQSDVTSVPISVPGISIEAPNKDQYKVLADVNQLIYDGGMTKEQKTLQQLTSVVEDQRIEVELYKVKERINQLYLGILYLDQQSRQTELVKDDLRTGIKKLDAQVKNGVAFKSNLNMLKAELLRAEQRSIEILASRKGLVESIGLLMGRTLPADVQLEMPVTADPASANALARPELKLYSDQSKLYSQQDRLIVAKNLPRASLFVQGGYGRPGLNLLKNEFDLYYIGGLRFTWSLGGLYTKKKEKQLTAINRKMVDAQQETFVLNTNTQLAQQQSEIDKLTALIISDKEIIELRESVKDAAKAQLENGVITANDYLKEVNAEDQARQSLITHEVQLLQAKINFQTISGNQ